jgi:6,7-dimethyl-8-ribityllumazine synthase
MADARRAPLKDQTDITGARALIVEARFYDDIQDALLEGAVAELKAAGVTHDVITVPGALEIPAAIAIALDAAERTASPMTRRSRSAAWCAATPSISRSSRWNPRAR